MIGLPYFRSAGKGPPIVFLHGWTMDGSVFDNQFERLAGRFTCIAPDLPGHGRSRTLKPSIGSAAAAVDALLVHLNLTGVTLVGWSMGAAVAWHLIGKYGTTRLSRLMSVDMSPKLVNDGDWQLGLKGQDATSSAAHTRRFRDDWPGSAASIAAGMFADPARYESCPIDSVTAKIRANDPAAMAAMWESLLAADARGLIPRLDIPLLAAHGARSRVYPAESAMWLAENAPMGTRHTFTRSGHSPHLEEPDAFADVVAAFAAR